MRPELYFAWGISGASQHRVGMKDARCIIAVNNDHHAAIFDIADLGVLADVDVLLPALVEAIRKRA